MPQAPKTRHPRWAVAALSVFAAACGHVAKPTIGDPKPAPTITDLTPFLPNPGAYLSGTDDGKIFSEYVWEENGGSFQWRCIDSWETCLRADGDGLYGHGLDVSEAGEGSRWFKLPMRGGDKWTDGDVRTTVVSTSTEIPFWGTNLPGCLVLDIEYPESDGAPAHTEREHWCPGLGRVQRETISPSKKLEERMVGVLPSDALDKKAPERFAAFRSRRRVSNKPPTAAATEGLRSLRKVVPGSDRVYTVDVLDSVRVEEEAPVELQGQVVAVAPAAAPGAQPGARHVFALNPDFEPAAKALRGNLSAQPVLDLAILPDGELSEGQSWTAEPTTIALESGPLSAPLVVTPRFTVTKLVGQSAQVSIQASGRARAKLHEYDLQFDINVQGVAQWDLTSRRPLRDVRTSTLTISRFDKDGTLLGVRRVDGTGVMQLGTEQESVLAELSEHPCPELPKRTPAPESCVALAHEMRARFEQSPKGIQFPVHLKMPTAKPDGTVLLRAEKGSPRIALANLPAGELVLKGAPQPAEPTLVVADSSTTVSQILALLGDDSPTLKLRVAVVVPGKDLPVPERIAESVRGVAEAAPDKIAEIASDFVSQSVGVCRGGIGAFASVAFSEPEGKSDLWRAGLLEALEECECQEWKLDEIAVWSDLLFGGPAVRALELSVTRQTTKPGTSIAADATLQDLVNAASQSTSAAVAVQDL